MLIIPGHRESIADYTDSILNVLSIKQVEDPRSLPDTFSRCQMISFQQNSGHLQN